MKIPLKEASDVVILTQLRGGHDPQLIMYFVFPLILAMLFQRFHLANIFKKSNKRQNLRYNSQLCYQLAWGVWQIIYFPWPYFLTM